MACVEAKKKCLPVGAKVDRDSAGTVGHSREMQMLADFGVVLLMQLGNIVKQLHWQNELLESWVKKQRDSEGKAAAVEGQIEKKKKKKKKGKEDKKDKGKGKEKAVEEESVEKDSGGEETEK